MSMNQHASPIRNISDTARSVAFYRALESERVDALFRDPFARRLAGARGEEIAAAMPTGQRHTWPYPVRTYLFDQFITEQVQQGADLVVNLAAGLDARLDVQDGCTPQTGFPHFPTSGAAPGIK